MLMYDIVIIGAGTAGMSAAIYGVRSGKKVLLLEEKNYGGQIVNTPEVENYPGIIKTSGLSLPQIFLIRQKVLVPKLSMKSCGN